MGQDIYCKKCGRFLCRVVPMDTKDPSGPKGISGSIGVKQEPDGPYFKCPDKDCGALNKVNVSR